MAVGSGSGRETGRPFDGSAGLARAARQTIERVRSHAAGTGEAPASAELARDALALADEVERLQRFLCAIVEHGRAIWGTTAAGRDAYGGAMITEEYFGELSFEIAAAANRCRSVTELADEYERAHPGTVRLDEAPNGVRRGPDGRPGPEPRVAT